ncbi:hypothetical protein FALBO_7193 [Fusarium albosuccineum]|uniref:Uncharacterized protein n=1 Tax=Fusarium albosuccineum TaxID=1237068 RepID=A0A8H4PDZ2_9HYPO|nr:hypothetical protein FALBO_7193 [Fusarium albosuccineum]
MGSRQARQKKPRQEQARSRKQHASPKHPRDPDPKEKSRRGEARPWDPAMQYLCGAVLLQQDPWVLGRFGLWPRGGAAARCERNRAYKSIRSILWPEANGGGDGGDMQIQDILRRQVVVDGELVRRPAKERKQAAKAKPYRVQKQTTERRLRRRNPSGHARQEPRASPALTQITVAGSEPTSGQPGASIWSVPSTPGSTAGRSLGNRRGGQHDGLEDMSDDEEEDDNHSLGHGTPASTHDEDADGEPYEAEGDIAAPIRDEEGDATQPDAAAVQQIAPPSFSAMLPNDVLMGDTAVDGGMSIGMGMDMGMDMDMDMDMGMGMDMPMPDYYMNFGDFDLNVGSDMGKSSHDAGPQGSCSNQTPRAPVADVSLTGATISVVPRETAAGDARQAGVAGTPNAAAMRPVPEPSRPAPRHTSAGAPGASPQVRDSARMQPGPSAEAKDMPRQTRPARPPADPTGQLGGCTILDVWGALEKAFYNVLARSELNGAPQSKYSVRGARTVTRLPTALVA